MDDDTKGIDPRFSVGTLPGDWRSNWRNLQRPSLLTKLLPFIGLNSGPSDDFHAGYARNPSSKFASIWRSWR